jgi:hypothetical protein
MPTDMDEPSIGEYNNDCADSDLQSASTTVAQIYTNQMDAYYATAAQVIDEKPIAHYMNSAIGHSQGAAAAITVASAGQSLATLEAYARCYSDCIAWLCNYCISPHVPAAAARSPSPCPGWACARQSRRRRCT